MSAAGSNSTAGEQLSPYTMQQVFEKGCEAIEAERSLQQQKDEKDAQQEKETVREQHRQLQDVKEKLKSVVDENLSKHFTITKDFPTCRLTTVKLHSSNTAQKQKGVTSKVMKQKDVITSIKTSVTTYPNSGHRGIVDDGKLNILVTVFIDDVGKREFGHALSGPPLVWPSDSTQRDIVTLVNCYVIGWFWSHCCPPEFKRM